MLRATACRHARDGTLALFAVSVHFGHLLAYEVGIHGLLWRFLDSHPTVVAVYKDNDILFRLALDLDGVDDTVGTRR